MTEVSTQSRLDELLDTHLGDMSDVELEKHIRNIQHTGIERAKKKAESRKPANAAAGRESMAIKQTREKLEAAGKTPAQIEQVITIMKETQATIKRAKK